MRLNIENVTGLPGGQCLLGIQCHHKEFPAICTVELLLLSDPPGTGFKRAFSTLGSVTRQGLRLCPVDFFQLSDGRGTGLLKGNIE